MVLGQESSRLTAWTRRALRRAVGREIDGTSRTREQRSFTVRLLGTLLLTLMLVTAAGYQLRRGPLRDRVIADALAEVEAEAAALRHAYLAHDDRSMSRAMARAITEGIRGRSGVIEVALLDVHGRPALVDEEHGMSDERSAQSAHPELAVLDEPTVVREGVHGDLEFFVPVRLPEGTIVLHVTRDSTLVDQQLVGLQRYSLLVVALGLPFGVVLFYLLGGRALSRRHRRALARSLQDGLTGLGNHRFYQEELRRSLLHADRHAESLSLLLMDIDDFKRINDSMGHGEGDQVLVQVAGLLIGLRAGDRAFRVGGDEFAVILAGSDEGAATRIAGRIQSAIDASMIGTTVSIGVAQYGPDTTAGELSTRADLALYEAKHRGRNAVVGFREIDGGDEVADACQRAALERVLSESSVHAVFQPIWDLASGRLIGHEALARVPEGPLKGPAHAFAVAELLDRTIELDHLCRQAALRRADRLPDDTLLFVNMVPQLLGHRSIADDRLVREVEAAGLEPGRVVLEITERGAIDRGMMATEVRRLRALGFQVAIDDVGTGDAGLEVLGQVSVDFLKIDRSLVSVAHDQMTARAVVLAVVAIATTTGATVIAEGIESEDMLEFVRNPGISADAVRIHAGQGYLLGEPHPSPRNRWDGPIGSPPPVRSSPVPVGW